MAATSAEMNYTDGVAIDANGDVVISDFWNYDVRVVAASSGTLGGQSVTADDIYALAGTGQYSDATYRGPPPTPSSTVLRRAHRRRRRRRDHRQRQQHDPLHSGRHRHLLRAIMTAHDIYTVAGDGTPGYSGNGGAATSAELNTPGARPRRIGDIAIADTNNNVVRFVPAISGTYFGQSMTADHIYTIAGNAPAGSSGNGGAATSAELDAPGGVAFDAHGDLVIADSPNNVIRFVPRPPAPTSASR